MPRPSFLVSAENVTRRFGRGDAAVTVLDGLNLTVPRGSWTTVVGPAGAGKTVLFECLSGVQLPDSGRITLHSADHSRRKPVEVSSLSDNARARLRRGRIGALPSEPDLIPTMTVRENILLAARLAHRRVDRAECAELVEFLGLTACLNRRPHELSIAQRRRIPLARVLVTGPDLILADEPTAGLEDSAAVQLLRILADLVELMPVTLVVLSARAETAERGDHTCYLINGRCHDEPAGHISPALSQPASHDEVPGRTPAQPVYREHRPGSGGHLVSPPRTPLEQIHTVRDEDSSRC